MTFLICKECLVFSSSKQDRVPPKSPSVADPEAWDLTQPRRFIHRGRMDSDYFANFFECQDLIVARH